MNADDVGKFFTTNGKDVWQMMSYCESPTATMRKLETDERIGGAIGSLNLKPFVRLIPEREVGEE